MEPRMTPLVRKYSLQIEGTMPDNALAQGLGMVATKEEEEDERKQNETQEWQEWLRFDLPPTGDQNLQRLHEKSRLVIDTWQQLSNQLSKNKNQRPDSTLNVPTIEELQTTVNQMDESSKKAKQAGFGRVKQGFLGFVNTLDDYSFIFSVIPNNDKYTSLITGILSSIAKASLNYQTTAEKISAALGEISGTIRMAQEHIKVVHTSETRLRLTQIYIKVFDFLCFSMLWYSSRFKRLMHSFNKNFDQKEVDPKIDAIKNEWQKLMDEVQLVTNTRVQGIDVTTQTTAHDISTMKDKFWGMEEKIDFIVEQLSLFKLGSIFGQHLVATEQHFTHDRKHVAIQWSTGIVEQREPVGNALKLDCDDTGGQVTPRSADSTCNSPEQHSTQQSLTLLSNHLHRFIEDGREWIFKEGNSMIRAALPQEVSAELETWLKHPVSKILWIEGPVSTPLGPTLSFASLYICSVVEDSGIPCVSYFCKGWYEFRISSAGAKLTTAEAALVSMLYSIISQLVNQLSVDFDKIDDLKDCFNLLDGSLPSLETALSLIRDLIPHLPSATIWILDGIQSTDGSTTTPYVEELIRILRNESSQKVTKVLFTTNGNSYSLMKNTRGTERVDAGRLAQERPGHLMPGGASF